MNPWLRRTALHAVIATAALLVISPNVAATGANTVAATKSGDGMAALGGYTASGIRYVLNATAPDNIDKVTLSLDTAPTAGSTLRLQLHSGGPWYSCTVSSTSVTCDTVTGGQATVTATDALRLIVAD